MHAWTSYACAALSAGSSTPLSSCHWPASPRREAATSSSHRQAPRPWLLPRCHGLPPAPYVSLGSALAPSSLHRAAAPRATTAPYLARAATPSPRCHTTACTQRLSLASLSCRVECRYSTGLTSSPWPPQARPPLPRRRATAHRAAPCMLATARRCQCMHTTELLQLLMHRYRRH